MNNNPTDINEAGIDYFINEVLISQGVGILVESPDNKKLFENLLHEKCRFYPANGWVNVIENIKKINLENNNNYALIGIIDADFRRISDEISTEKNIFMTDHHDTEIMIISSVALEKLNILIDKEKIQTFENQQNKSLRDFILELIRPISVLRWLSYRDNLGLTFKTRLGSKKDDVELASKTQSKSKEDKYIDYDDFIDEKYNFTNADLLKAVENKSEKQNFFKNNPKIKQDFEDLLKENFDLKELSNGHDFMNVLAMILKRIAKNSQIKVADIETNFIFAYHLTDFQKTNLHQSLAVWETQKQGFKVLRTII